MTTLSESQSEASSPKVSVIIPAYNASKFIREAINSVLNQTYKDYEIIVVDGRDGSTDNTREIVAEYGDAVRYFRQEDRGLSDARNKGILNSKGEYIAFLDSDDLWSENKLALQVEFLDSHRDVGLVFYDVTHVKTNPLTWLLTRSVGLFPYTLLSSITNLANFTGLKLPCHIPTVSFCYLPQCIL